MNSSITDLIRMRSSWRNYDGQPLEAPMAERLGRAIANPPRPPFGNTVRLALVEYDPAGKSEKLGTYGVIRGARSFLVGAVPQAEHCNEDYGFVFEWAILKATDMGLGTCWLGGTLKRGAFARAVGATPDERMLAASPVGVKTSRRGVVDRTIRAVAGSRKRKPWQELFFMDGEALPQQRAGELAVPLEMVRLGPSASNNQPWRIHVAPDLSAVHLFLKRTPGYQKVPQVDLQLLDMGIAMCHFQLSAAEAGLAGSWAGGSPPSHIDGEGMEYVASWTREI